MNGNESLNRISAKALKLLRELRNTHKVDTVWVKGHSTCAGNEYADLLSRLGREKARGLSYAAPFVPLSGKGIKDIVHKGCIVEWQSSWELSKDCHVLLLNSSTQG